MVRAPGGTCASVVNTGEYAFARLRHVVPNGPWECGLTAQMESICAGKIAAYDGQRTGHRQQQYFRQEVCWNRPAHGVCQWSGVPGTDIHGPGVLVEVPKEMGNI